MKILIALDESENALRAVEFIADHFTSEHQVTVFSVIPEVSVVCEWQQKRNNPACQLIRINALINALWTTKL